MTRSTLDAFLNSHALSGDIMRSEVVDVVRALASVSIRVGNLIRQGRLDTALSGGHAVNAAGDVRKELDVEADTMFLDAMRGTPVALYASEAPGSPTILDPSAPLAVAIDPLDGSSDIETNSVAGTVFSILPALQDAATGSDATFLQPGRRQLAAGFVVYGPQLAICLTLGSGTHIFVFSTRLGAFVQAHDSRVIPPRAQEFAINASNYRHWHEAVRLYIDDCLKGAEGPRERDFNMRWNASLVAEAFRILLRGGVYLYPADARSGLSRGHLRLVFKANPVAFLIEQAGGGATDTVNDILDLVPESLHQRTPLVFGSAREVAHIARYHTEPSMIGERAPLFSNRGLFRA
jgi:fructose-1,6-bisphosphatase I